MNTPVDRPALNSVAGQTYDESNWPGSAVYGFEAVPLEARAKGGSLGSLGLPPARSSAESGNQLQVKNLRGG